MEIYGRDLHCSSREDGECYDAAPHQHGFRCCPNFGIGLPHPAIAVSTVKLIVQQDDVGVVYTRRQAGCRVLFCRNWAD
jgi:hypothetical protein